MTHKGYYPEYYHRYELCMTIAKNFQTILLSKMLLLNATEVLQLEAVLNVYCMHGSVYICTCVCTCMCIYAHVCACIGLAIKGYKVQFLVRPPWCCCFLSKNFINIAPYSPPSGPGVNWGIYPVGLGSLPSGPGVNWGSSCNINRYLRKKMSTVHVLCSDPGGTLGGHTFI